MKNILNNKKVCLLICSILILLQHTFAQPGSIDSSFNTFDDGTYGDCSGFNNTVYSTAIQTDGKIVVGGQFTTFNGAQKFRIARLNPIGNTDTSFNIGTGFNGIVRTIAIQTDGKIIVGGEFTSFNGIARNRIARLNSDGTIDATFNPGTGFNGITYFATIQEDGKIIVGGNYTSFNGSTNNRIIRLNSDGSIDTIFNSGTGFSGVVYATAIQTDGKIIAGGQFSTFNGNNTNCIARLNADGSNDSTFNIGTGFDNIVRSISIQADGKIIVVGSFTSFNGTTINRIARLNTDGSLDTTFVTGTGFDNTVYSVSIQTDGKIILGGDFTTYNYSTKFRITRLNTNGSIDLTLNMGTGFNGYVNTTSIQVNGKIIVGGNFTTFNGADRFYLAGLNKDGSLDSNFNTGLGFNNEVYTTAIQSDGKILVGGKFTSFNGKNKGFIARLNSDGSLDTTFSSVINGFVYSIAIQSNGKIIVGGDFTYFININRNRIARLNTNGSLDTTFNPQAGFNKVVNTVALQLDGKIIVGGEFTTFNSNSHRRIVRLNTDGNIDSTFNTGSGFGPLVGNTSVYATAIQPDGKIVVIGEFTSFNGGATNRIARLNSDGSWDPYFTPGTGFNYTAYALALQGDGKIIVGGWMSAYNGTATPRITRLNKNGTLDSNFKPGTGFNGAVLSITIQPDGKIIAGGGFTSFNGIHRNRIARLKGECISTVVHTISACNSYTWIDGNTYTSNNNTASDTLTNIAGCDSINILNLTINTLNLTTSLNGNVITSNETGASYQWIDCGNYQPINGATNQSYTATSNGNYACIITKNNCSDTTACVLVAGVGLDDNFANQIRIYPNPTNNNLHIELNQNGIIRVYTIEGKLIENISTNTSSHTLNVSSYSKGLYTILFTGDNGTQSQTRFVKE